MKPEDSSVPSTEKTVEKGPMITHGRSPRGENAGLIRPRLLASLAGLIVGLVAFGLGEIFYDWYPPAGVPQMLGGASVTTPTVETVIVADTRNSALSFALLGGCMGLVFGLAGALARGSGRATLAAVLIGLLGGAVLGALLPLILVGPSDCNTCGTPTIFWCLWPCTRYFGGPSAPSPDWPSGSA
jgi:hypothetical protein